jgi:hypothetical protein
MVSADSRRVSRAPRYSGIGFESRPLSLTRLSRSMAPLSRGLQLAAGLVTLLLPTLQPLDHPKVIQVWAVPISLATTFGIEFLSFPPGTEMVHFPGFARAHLWIRWAVSRFKAGWVAPFGDPRVKACLRLSGAYRSLPRPSSPASAKASTMRP